MLYINEKDILDIGVNWNETIDVIKDAVIALNNKDYSQPIKPYLRYKNPMNRIIAMPAYVGGNIDIAGIKWIASFPDNVYSDIPRAHSVVILYDANNGKPIAIINTALLSVIRTASVSGLIISKLDKYRSINDIRIGIIGWGPIGKYHYTMCKELLGKRISKVFLFDQRPIIDKDNSIFENNMEVVVCDNWEEVFRESDIFITCTVAKPNIDKAPKKGMLMLNVSLRDYKPNFFQYVKKSIIVDDWDEVCRENTDIEVFHQQHGLKKEEVSTISDIVCHKGFSKYKDDDSIMFNPMGMAIFDVGIGSYFLHKAIEKNSGTLLQ